MQAESPELLSCLAGVRSRARRLAVACGFFQGLGCAALLFAAMAGLDWLFDLPPVLRTGMSAVFVGAGLGWAWRRVWRPATARISLDAIALRLESRFGQLNDRLASAVNFLQSESGASPVLVRHMVSETAALTRSLPLRDALTSSPAWKMVGLAGLVGVGVLGIALAAPSVPGIALMRFGQPFGATQWPKRVHIEPLSGTGTVALGGSFITEMRIDRGRRRNERAWVHITDDAGRRRRDLLSFDEARGVYHRTYDGLTEGFVYRFEAGDATAPNESLQVRVVRRPAVVRATLRLTLPAYVRDAQPLELPLDGTGVTALVGSRAELIVETSKPIGDASASPGEIPATAVFGQGPIVTLRAEDNTRQRLRGTFDIRTSDTFDIHLVGKDGFENRDRRRYPIVAKPDEVAQVVIVEPKSVIEVTPDGSVKLRIEADDDFGLDTLKLRYHIESSQLDDEWDLTDSLDVRTSAGRKTAIVSPLWSLAPLGLQAGDLVRYHAEATDNFVLDGERHAPSVSPTMRLKVISHAEFAARIRDAFRLLAERLREVRTGEETLGDEVEAIAADVEQGKELTASDREALEQIEARQRHLAARSRQLSDQFAGLARRMAMNNVRDAESQQRAGESAEQLKQIAAGPMRGVEQGLQQARAGRNVDPQKQALAQTGQQAQRAVEALDQLIQQMNQWGDFQEIVQTTRDLLDRQQAVRRQTRQVAKDTLGQSAEELSAEQAKAVRAVTREQDRLAEESDRLMRRMDRMADSRREREPMESDLLRAAARSGRAAGVSGQMKQASARLRENRAGQAGSRQAAAEAGLAKMIEQLEERQERELAALQKRLEKMDEALRRQLAQQTELREQTRGARARENATEETQKLAEPQDGLKRNTQQLAEEIGRTGKATQVSRTTARAAGQMARATTKLAAGAAPDAENRQTGAIEELEEALRQLAALQQEADEQIARKALAEIRDELQAVRDKQAEIKAATEEMLTRFGETGRRSRTAYRQLRRLATDEQAVKTTTETLQEELTAAVVYAWTLRRVVGRMEDIRERFEARRLEPETVARQDKVLADLDRLLEASKRDPNPEPRNGPEFAGAGGQPSGGQGNGSNPIPASAQLKVLRLLQVTINERTQTLDQRVDPRDASEDDLQELKDLADEQRDVRQLLEQMVRRPRLTR